MKTAEIRELSTKEIQERIEGDKAMLVKLKLNHAVSALENPLKIRAMRKDVARLNSEIRKRQLSDNK